MYIYVYINILSRLLGHTCGSASKYRCLSSLLARTFAVYLLAPTSVLRIYLPSPLCLVYLPVSLRCLTCGHVEHVYHAVPCMCTILYHAVPCNYTATCPYLSHASHASHAHTSSRPRMEKSHSGCSRTASCVVK